MNYKEFDTLEAFVHFLLHIYDYPVDRNGRTWCKEWRKHPSVVFRLNIAKAAYEQAARAGDTDIFYLMVNHLDVMMARIMEDTGFFADCTGKEHSEPEDTIRPKSLRPLDIEQKITVEYWKNNKDKE